MPAFRNTFEACLLVAVIVTSPYAMFTCDGRGCEGEDRGDEPVRPDARARDPGTSPDMSGSEEDDPAPYVPHDADDEVAEETAACTIPDSPVERTAGCADGADYPACRWRLPPPGEDDPWIVWRNTSEDHRWGRPALVALVLATAEEYASAHHGEKLTVGDLDAPGERHMTHASGVDVDLYLPGHMATENVSQGNYPSNYDGRPGEEVAAKRERVLALARILARCTGGRLRIYYNDPPVVETFLEWFATEGFTSPLGDAMQPHNRLHLFHFHVTIPEDLEVLPVAGDG